MTPRIQANDLKTLGRSFPARELTTELSWHDVESYDSIERQLAELREDTRRFRETDNSGSYRVLFSGPPGTGKTLTGLLMGRGKRAKSRLCRSSEPDLAVYRRDGKEPDQASLQGGSGKLASLL